MLIPEAVARLGMFVQIKYPIQINNAILLVPPRRNDGGSPNGPPSSNGHYSHWSGGRCDGHHGAPGQGDDGSSDDAYEGGSDSSSFSQSERHRHEQCIKTW